MILAVKLTVVVDDGAPEMLRTFPLTVAIMVPLPRLAVPRLLRELVPLMSQVKLVPTVSVALMEPV